MNNEQQIINSFQGGLNSDISPYNTSKEVYTYLENGTFITHNGNELILQNEKGTIAVGSLKENYYPIAVKSFGNIAYILSAEIEKHEVSETGLIFYNELFSQHFIKNIKPGTYNVKLTPENDSISIPVQISTVKKGTIFSNIINSETIFQVVIEEDDEIMTNKSGYNYQFILEKLESRKYPVSFTGRGEIGSFPSPDYENVERFDCVSGGACNFRTKLVEKYHPFLNYRGDENVPVNPVIGFSSVLGELNSIFFNFCEEHPVEIVSIQPSYDGTVNVIFTDHFNTPKLINSRFASIGNNVVEIYDRRGSRDDNTYVKNDWATRLNHVLSTNKLSYVSLLDQPKDGQLPAGTYRYYFTYSTQDDNETDIFSESSVVTVFEGDSVGLTRGNLKNINTNKSNVILIENIDTSFNFINVYFSYFTGTTSVDSVGDTFKLDRRYEIRENSIEIKHTGFELTNPIPQTDLNLNYSAIGTYKTGAEVKGRLFIGNIRTRNYNFNLLQDYASKITVKAGVIKMQVNGLESGDIELTHLKRENFTRRKVFDAYAEGYANASNIHDYLGYWGGETYMYAIEFIMKDGTSTPLFTIRGVDDIEDNGTYTFSSDITVEDDFNITTGENLRGIYRFPKRVDGEVNPSRFKLITNSLAGTSAELTGQGLSCINVMHPNFNIPNLPQELVNEGVIGFRLHRSQRKKDVLMQGLMFNTVLIPNTNNIRTNPGNNTDRLSQFYSNSGGYNSFRGKFIPAFNLFLETYFRYSKEITGDPLWRTPSVNARGLECIQVSPVNYRLDVTDNEFKRFDQKYFALITPDLLTNQSRVVNLLTRDGYSLQPIQRCVFEHAKTSHLGVPRTETQGYFNDQVNRDNSRFTHFSVFKHVNGDFLRKERFVIDMILPDESLLLPITLDFVDAFQQGVTENRFTSIAECQGEFRSYHAKTIIEGHQNRTLDRAFYAFFELAYLPYIGVKINKDKFEIPKYFSLSRFSDVKRISFNTMESLPLPQTPAQISSIPENEIFSGASDGIDGYFVEYSKIGRRVENAGVIVNIYPESGPRSLLSIRDLYFETDIFSPITQKIYFSNSLAEEYNAVKLQNGKYNSLEDLKTNVGLPAFGGDCFINMNYRRLFYNNLERLVVDDKEEQRSINPGYTVAFVCESDTNNYGRTESIEAITDEQISSFYPPIAKNSTATGDQRGRGNLWREYRQQETRQYNSGYSRTISDKNYVATNLQSPFINTNFQTRIAFSDEYIVSNFQNGYRRFGLINYRDYPSSLGRLIALRNFSDNLLAVFEFGIALIPVSERVGGVGDSAGSVFFDSIAVLAEAKYVRYLSEIYGSTWQQSVISTNNGVYGVDTNAGKIWRVSNGLELISDFKVQSFIRSEVQPKFKGKNQNMLTKNIHTYFDKLKNSVMFHFLDAEDTDCGTVKIKKLATCSDIQLIQNNIILINGGTGEQEVEKNLICTEKAFNKLLVFNELPTNQWQTFHSWKPFLMFNNYDRLYSFPYLKETNRLYEHYKNEKNLFVYDNQEDFVIEFIATAGTGTHQVFENMKIICNHIYPYKIEYTTDSDNFTQLIRPRNIIAKGSESYMVEPINDIFNYNAVYREDHLYIQLSHERKDVVLDEFFTNRRIRDKYCRIRMYFNTSDKIIIQAILTSITL